MECSTWAESLPGNRIKAIQELTNGEILTDKLREMLGRPEDFRSDIKSDTNVVIQTLKMFDNTLSIFNSSDLNGLLYDSIGDMRFSYSTDYQKSKDAGENTNTMTFLKTKRGCYKRKKNASTFTKVTSTLIDDGYFWRKYGQKKILNSKYQRNYYRCSYKSEQGCQATKQIQKINDNPSKYTIRYIGVHTCNRLQIDPKIFGEAPNPKDNSILISFETNLLPENNKLGSCFQSMKHTPKDGFPSLDPLKDERISTSDHDASWDPIVELSQVQLEPMSCENMVPSEVVSSPYAYRYEIDSMIESHEYDDFLLELW